LPARCRRRPPAAEDDARRVLVEITHRAVDGVERAAAVHDQTVEPLVEIFRESLEGSHRLRDVALLSCQCIDIAQNAVRTHQNAVDLL
jgi:hypothetical protein